MSQSLVLNQYGEIEEYKVVKSTITAAADWATLTNKPTTFAPAVHQHPWADVSGKPTTFPAETHVHAWTALTGVPLTKGTTTVTADGTGAVLTKTVTHSLNITGYSVLLQASDPTLLLGTTLVSTSANSFDIKVWTVGGANFPAQAVSVQWLVHA